MNNVPRYNFTEEFAQCLVREKTWASIITSQNNIVADREYYSSRQNIIRDTFNPHGNLIGQHSAIFIAYSDALIRSDSLDQ